MGTELRCYTIYNVTVKNDFILCQLHNTRLSQGNAIINMSAKVGASGAIIHVSGLPKRKARQTLIIAHK